MSRVMSPSLCGELEAHEKSRSPRARRAAALSTHSGALTIRRSPRAISTHSAGAEFHLQHLLVQTLHEVPQRSQSIPGSGVTWSAEVTALAPGASCHRMIAQGNGVIASARGVTIHFMPVFALRSENDVPHSSQARITPVSL